MSEEFAFGGTECKKTTVRAIVLGDSAYFADGVSSLFEDQTRAFVALFEQNEQPFDALGRVTGFNYTGISRSRVGSTTSFYLGDVRSMTIQREGYREIGDSNTQIYPVLVDFELKSYRQPRGA